MPYFIKLCGMLQGVFQGCECKCVHGIFSVASKMKEISSHMATNCTQQKSKRTKEKFAQHLTFLHMGLKKNKSKSKVERRNLGLPLDGKHASNLGRVIMDPVVFVRK